MVLEFINFSAFRAALSASADTDSLSFVVEEQPKGPMESLLDRFYHLTRRPLASAAERQQLQYLLDDCQQAKLLQELTAEQAASLTDLMRRIGFCMNQQSWGLLSLPDDLLSLIMEFVCAYEVDRVSEITFPTQDTIDAWFSHPLTFTQISHRFRVVALATPLIWNKFVFDPSQRDRRRQSHTLSHLFLQRSDTAPLHIFINAQRSSEAVRCLQQLQEHSHRWYTLQLMAADIPESRVVDALRKIDITELPILDTLVMSGMRVTKWFFLLYYPARLNVLNTEDEWMDSVPYEPPVLAPVLGPRTITSCLTSAVIKTEFMASIRTSQGAQSTAVDHTLCNLLASLTCFPKLTELALVLLIPSSSTPEEGTFSPNLPAYKMKRFQFPTLENLEIKIRFRVPSSQNPTCHQFPRAMEMPNLRSLRVACVAEAEHSGSVGEDFLRSLYTGAGVHLQLQQLDIHYSSYKSGGSNELPKHILHDIISAMPNLRDLRTVGMMCTLCPGCGGNANCLEDAVIPPLRHITLVGAGIPWTKRVVESLKRRTAAWDFLQQITVEPVYHSANGMEEIRRVLKRDGKQLLYIAGAGNTLEV